MSDDREREDRAEHELRMTRLRQKATEFITQIDFPMADELHAVIRGKEMGKAAATLASVLADVVSALSKTSHGVTDNVLVVEEAMQRIAHHGFKKAQEEKAAAEAARH